ncbi:uncharacterized protein LOC143882605 [Tasmannia lanceolata]|uniref:uncharacterized protein LOC143882605 n=1 Tax=Tasmannia lanceolata TaxID=3420 RepID=UPI004064935F
MDRRFYRASLRGDVAAFLSLIQEDKHILEQTTRPLRSTVLHLASRLGHLELVAEIIRLRPDMVSMENEKMETPLHEACREGHVEVLRMLLETDPWIAYMLNCNNESALYVGCSRGHKNVVKRLLNKPQFLVAEQDSPSTSLHVAASMGYSDIVEEILKVGPEFASKLDSRGCSPLHLASAKGHLAVTQQLLRIDCHLCLLTDDNGRTPLHLAAIGGKVSVLNEILSKNLDSARKLTKQGETILHLSVANNQYYALKYLAETVSITNFINLPDGNGNTVLHLATERRLPKMAKYLVNKTKIKVNALNTNGFTALDLLYGATNKNSITLQLIEMLERVGGKRSSELTPQSLVNLHESDQMGPSPSVNRIPESPKCSPPHQLHRKNQIELHNELCNRLTTLNGTKHSPTRLLQVHKTTKLPLTKKDFVISSEALSCLGRLQLEQHSEGVQNGRDLIVFFAILIGTVSFAYGAGTWVIMPSCRGVTWIQVAFLAIGVGSLGSVLICLGVILAKCLIKKSESKRSSKQRREGMPRRKGKRSRKVIHQKKEKEQIESRNLRTEKEEIEGGSDSGDSDMESSRKTAYHTC